MLSSSASVLDTVNPTRPRRATQLRCVSHPFGGVHHATGRCAGFAAARPGHGIVSPMHYPVALRISALPEFVEEHRKVLIQTPIRIAIIIIAAIITRWILRRMIDRALRPAANGEMPRLLRPFKERIETDVLEAKGILSERRRQRAATLGSVLKSVTTITVWVIAVLMILGELNFDLAPFIAGTSIIGVALAFGAQNIVKDFLSGLFMLFEDQYGVGDVIDFEKASGTVEAVNLRVTRLRDVNGTVWYVRNGEVVRVGNKSQGFAQVVLDIPIDAWADLSAASQAMLDVGTTMAAEEAWTPVFLSPPEMQGVEQMTREETVIRLVAKVRPLEQWRTARELRRRIRERLDTLDIDTRVPPDGSPPEPAEPNGTS
jgi:moderate conductance mechanosensitive channel